MKRNIRPLIISVCAAMSMSSAIFAATVTTSTPPTTPVKPAAIAPATTPAATEPATPVTTTATTSVATTSVSAFTPDQVNQLHDIIRSYLISNPQVLVDASQAWQAQQQKKMESMAMTAIPQNKTALFDDAQSPSIGDKNAPVTLIEFFDYQCGHCHQVAPIVEQLVKTNKNLRVVFKELPIFGGMSEFAAKAALASIKQDKYYTFHSLLFTANGPLTKDKVMELAKQAGLNVAKLKKDMDAPTIQKQIRDNFQLAQALKIMGTPAFVIGNKAQDKFRFIPGATSLNELQAQIKDVG